MGSRAHRWLTVAILFGRCWGAFVLLGLTGGPGKAGRILWGVVGASAIWSLSGEKRTCADIAFLQRMTQGRRSA